ncbi:hypothetical protein SEA_PUREGLOBE5_87 [Arthrobacter phage Pureglobe5]|nr:hypothetical protein PBI_BEAGLE_89 [Arthrobacter phage Beagle]UYL87450.1 hypothetical protein SEA_PUREGLOBE5_87 [Arthrobacter phage Pureglobe5]
MSHTESLADYFGTARTKLARVPNSQEAALVEDNKVRMTLRSYESLAQYVAVLERKLRDTDENRTLLHAIEETIDRHHPSNDVRLVQGDAMEITGLGHEVLYIIEQCGGALP